MPLFVVYHAAYSEIIIILNEIFFFMQSAITSHDRVLLIFKNKQMKSDSYFIPFLVLVVKW